MEVTRKELAGGVDLICVRTEKFKTGTPSVSFAAPLRRETATANALVTSRPSRPRRTSFTGWRSIPACGSGVKRSA